MDDDPAQGELELGIAAPDGRPEPQRGVSAELWRILLADLDTVARYRSHVHQRAASACWYWTAAISSTGHGKLRAGSKTRGTSRVITAHVFGYQLFSAHDGPLVASPGQELVVRHTCDEASCQNPAHWQLGERAANVADYLTRRHRDHGPLADVRGPAGRAVAIREAIRAARAEGRDVELAITAAIAAGEADTLRLL
ncbi:hypothetical protein [Nonomuraea typhae]|uniref:hypothetical protein n=1 Tax=Nonomuraea typhae TaxID=2603600 RepID=UPI001CA4BB2F|nr:hypothetical protein [Nonomuraea typhae]